MKMLRPFLAALSLTAAVRSGAAESAIPLQNSIELQAARQKFIAGRRATVYYTGQRFDLDQLPSYQPRAQVRGTLRIWGLNYLGDSMLAQYWKDGFARYQPGITIAYHLPVAMAATSALVTGACDLGVNRKMSFTEVLQFQRVFNRDVLEIPMATGSLDVAGWSDAMCIFVNRHNPISGLTLEQLDGIFGAARLGGWVGTAWHPEFARGTDRNIRTWGQAGLTGEWSDQAVHPYGAVIRYDTATKFSDAVLHSSDQWNERTAMFANYTRADGSFAIWEQLIADHLATDLQGIAYDGHGFANDQMKVVPIQFEPGGPFVTPTLKTLQDRSYRLFQANYWYVNRVPGQPVDPMVREFLTYVLSREGQEQIVRDGKYLPLNRNLVRNALRSLE
jgi:phosphate transport system substrate-binding protein